MRYTIIGILVSLVFLSCARSVEPTVENINKIFESKDFTFEFHQPDGSCRSLSFRNDYVVYKSDLPTYRRGIEYEEVVLINDYIQKIVNEHSTTLDRENHPYYVIKNTAYKVTIIPEQEAFYFDALLKTLKLDPAQIK